MKWSIYRGTGKEKGKPLHESITQYDGKGKVVYQDTFEYVGKWMGECYLTVSIKSPYPIDFQIGDYIEYRGEKFTINYDPTVIKKARRGTYGEGFVYDSIKFNSYSNELTMMLFHDWVLDDNKVHYTSLPTFSFYAKDVDDLVDRLQACADRWCKDNKRDKSEYWMFYTLANNTQGTKDAGQYQTTYDRTVQRAQDISTDSAFLSAVQSEWIKTYGDPSDYKDSRDDERYDRNISISNNTVWDGLQKVKTEFGLNFIIRGRNVYIGTVGIPTSHLFEYGKGKGLYEVDKTAETDQKVVTRLHAYGSDQNMPTRYYAELNVQPFGVIESVLRSSNEANCTDYKSGSADYLAVFYIDIPFRADLFNTETSYDSIGQKYNDTVGYIVKFHLEGSTDVITAMIANEKGLVVKESGNNYCQVIVTYNDPSNTFVKDWSERDHTAFLRMSAALQAGKKIIFDGGIKNDAVPAQNKYYNSDNLPDNMAVNSLMLPGFPLYSLADICKSEYDSASNSTNYYIKKKPSNADSDYVLFHTESGKHLITFSNDRHDPYIVSQNAASLGYRDGDISCTESNDDNGLEAVYPSIEKVTVSDAGVGSGTARLDTIDSADTIDDNGVYDKEGVSVPSFHVTLPKLGFDLRQAAKDANSNGEFKLSMKDGFCGGREFTAKVESVDASTGKITLRVQRSYDDALSLWFPYSYAKSVQTVGSGMTNAYQILPGDHFVLTGINVSDVNYVWTASVRLLRKAIHWLCKNDYTRYVYTPKIDEIFMARQDLEAKSDTSGKTASIHDTLKEGDILLFDDDDLLISGSVYIDQLTIKENGNNGIPTYDVTLRNEVNVGTLQRIQNKVDSVANDIRTGNIGGNVGMTPTQVDPLIKTYGDKYFLSKTHDDFTPYKLTMGEAEVKGDANVGKNLNVGGNTTVGGVAALKGGAAFGTGGYKFDEKGNLVVSDVASLGFDEALERGFGIKKNAQGKYTLSVTDLMVWGKAVFNSLEIRKLYAVGGNVYLSGASSKIVRVVPVKRATAASSSTGGDASETWVACAEGDADCEGWKCYTLNDDGTTATQNGWRKYDQAKCQTFDIKDGAHDGVSNTFYWRLVVDVSTENETITETRTETYVDDDGVTKTRDVTVDLYDGKKFGWVVLSKTDCENPKTNDAPKAGDTIVLDGHRMFASGDSLGRDQYNDESRTNVLMLETTGTQDGTLPRIVALTGIVNYKHSEDDNHPYSNTVFILSPKKVVFVSSSFEWIGANGDPITLVNFRGNWTDGTEYGYYDQVSHNDSIWTCVVKKGTKTTEEPSDTSKDWRKEISSGTPEIAKLRVDHSALHYNPATKKWDYDSVTVTIVIFTSNGTKILSSNDVSEYYWMLDTDTTITERKSGWGFSAPTDDAASRTVTLYKKYKKEDGSEASVAIDTITVPMVRDGAPGADGKDAPIMVCLYAVGQSNTFRSSGLRELKFDDGVLNSYGDWSFTAPDAGQYYLWQASFLGYLRGNGTYKKADNAVVSYVCLTGPSGSQGASGKDALEIVCDPETIVLDTDINGLVKDLTNAKAVLKCMRKGVTVSGVTYKIGNNDTVNCTATVDNNGKVTITSVTEQQVTIDGNTVSVSSTSGSVTVSVTVSGVTYTKTVPFTVNVARYTGGLKADNKKLQSQYSLLTNDGNGGSITSLTEYKSEILQTAKEISLKVSEKSVGRRNMLVGSACRKYGDGFTYMSGSQTQYYNGYPLEQIEINSGIDGVNCIHCRTKQYATDGAYSSGFRWNGDSPQGNIKLEKGKNYVLSFYAKTHTPNGIVFVAEAIYQGSNTDTTRPYGYDGPTGFSHTFSASEAGKWELFTVKLSVPSKPKSEYVEINIFARATGYSFVDGYICKPMLEEGDEYNGWTLSEQDYDYVGGNLLDGTGTLTKTGNVEALNVTVKQGGYNNESASVVATLSPTVANNDFLSYSTTKMGLKAGDDYMLSFYARSSGKGILQCYLYPSTGGIFTESSHEKIDGVWNPSDGDLRTPIAPTTAWKRYWVHWRPSVNDPQHVLFRLQRPGTDKGSYSSSTSYNVGDVVLYGGTYYVCKKAGSGYRLGVPGSSSYWEASWFSIEIARPKLEVGATMTEWTEKRADMVDKRALLATGIDIDSKKITATADNFVVRNNSGETTLNLDEDGKLQAGSLTTMDNGRGWTEIEGSTTIWRRADGDPGIQVFYDETGVPHLQFMMKMQDGKTVVAYDLGPTGLKNLLDQKHDAYTEAVTLYGYSSNEPSEPLGTSGTTYYKFHKAVYPYDSVSQQDEDAKYDGKLMNNYAKDVTKITKNSNIVDNQGTLWYLNSGPLFISDGWYGLVPESTDTDGSGNVRRWQIVGYYSGGILKSSEAITSY